MWQPPSPSTVANTNPADNTASASYTITPRTDVTITKVAAPNPAVAGQNLVYVLTATNFDNGLSDAENVSIVDLLPENVTFLSATPSVGSWPVTPYPARRGGRRHGRVFARRGS